MSEQWVLAQVTESRMRASLDDPLMARFRFAFDAVSQVARDSPGFCWQLESQERGHPVVASNDQLRVVTVSTWADYRSLHAFVYRSAHGQALLRRQDWFLPVKQPSTALWWAPADASISVENALDRLSYLRHHGPTPRAFGLRRRFTVDGKVDRGR